MTLVANRLKDDARNPDAATKKTETLKPPSSTMSEICRSRSRTICVDVRSVFQEPWNFRSTAQGLHSRSPDASHRAPDQSTESTDDEGSFSPVCWCDFHWGPSLVFEAVRRTSTVIFQRTARHMYTAGGLTRFVEPRHSVTHIWTISSTLVGITASQLRTGCPVLLARRHHIDTAPPYSTSSAALLVLLQMVACFYLLASTPIQAGIRIENASAGRRLVNSSHISTWYRPCLLGRTPS